MNENRESRRQKALKTGKIMLSKSSLLDCRIVDISETGARLELDGHTFLPLKFKLRFVTSGKEIPVALAWQRGTEAGVLFASADD